ncbi:hypothetical protein F5Y18DRAFT_76039 [Xylariaceae sp. FL1019]|nr:hypothetical protein F5Y18DRAFT_76039 [Xylariaceae sp. FL1019]
MAPHPHAKPDNFDRYMIRKSKDGRSDLSGSHFCDYGLQLEMHRWRCIAPMTYRGHWDGPVSILLVSHRAALTTMAGVLTDRAGATILLAIGNIGRLLTTFLSSLSAQYYQPFLSQAIAPRVNCVLKFDA